MYIRLIFVVTTTLTGAVAWGSGAHAVVAQISQNRIKRRTQDAIDAIIGRGIPMASYADWADKIIRGSGAGNWKWSVRLHYVTTTDCSLNYIRDCPKRGCVVGALKNYSKRVVDESLPLRQRQEALKFLVHFVGDAHQPLHAGKPQDFGGLKIGVRLGFASHQFTNLHATWDLDLLYEFESRGHLAPGVPDWRVAEKAISEDFRRGGRYANNVEKWIEDCEKYGLDACIDKWVDETAKAACDYSYKHVDGSPVRNNDVLPMKYYERRIDVAMEQLAKGSVRLTWLLDNLFASKNATRGRSLQNRRVLPNRLR